MNHHETLGVRPSASEAEIQDAFRQAAKELHPDHSNSPEAAEAFIHIKEARDALLKEIANAPPKETAQAAAANAVRATTQQAFTPPPAPTPSPARIAHLQELDRQVAKASAFSLFKFKRKKESDELKRHRHRIKINDRRLNGKY